jgi:hypothetical protein
MIFSLVHKDLAPLQIHRDTRHAINSRGVARIDTFFDGWRNEDLEFQGEIEENDFWKSRMGNGEAQQTGSRR